MTEREMTAEESDAEMSASRECNIETARSTNFEAYLAVKARAELAEARADRLQDALRGVRDALKNADGSLRYIATQAKAGHPGFATVARMNAESAQERLATTLSTIDALLSGADHA